MAWVHMVSGGNVETGATRPRRAPEGGFSEKKGVRLS